jgi:citrate synthase I (hexameric type)
MENEKKAVLNLEGKTYELPVIEGSEGEKGIDITSLRDKTGYITYDNGLVNTGSCISTITFVDGENGVLRYRGYDIADLAEHCTFVETAYLLIKGQLPTSKELTRFSTYLNEHSLIHEDMTHFFTGFPPSSHPMSILAAMVTSLSSFYPSLSDTDANFEITTARLLSKVRTIAAFSYKKVLGEPFVYPQYELSYCANFLNMMFASSVKNYHPEPLFVKALNKVLILHADHEQNCSTSTVRLVGSARVDLYAAIAAAIAALWGPLHGGAAQAVVEMLEMIRADGGNIGKYIAKAKDKNDPFRLMGFGHRVYKKYDPRAEILRATCDELFAAMHLSDPLLDLAKELEKIALTDEYFLERHLYPNVDFYSGIIYRAIGIPINMFTVMFAIGRLPGWIAQWKESADDKSWKIWRPRQIYTGEKQREFLSIQKRE